MGYVLIDNKVIKFAPFAGIAATDIGPPEQDIKKVPDLSQVDLKFTTTYSLGLNIDFKLISDKTSVVSAGRAQDYLFIRVRYSYDITQFKNKYAGFGGNMHNLTIGIGIRAGLFEYARLK